MEGSEGHSGGKTASEPTGGNSHRYARQDRLALGTAGKGSTGVSHGAVDSGTGVQAREKTLFSSGYKLTGRYKSVCSDETC